MKKGRKFSVSVRGGGDSPGEALNVLRVDQDPLYPPSRLTPPRAPVRLDGMREVRGRVALVTGASGGLGAHISRALAREGVDVAVCARREEELLRIAEELRGLGVRAEPVPADLSDLGLVNSIVERTENVLGPIDIVVNNAGLEVMSSFTSLKSDEITSMVKVNLTAPLLLTHRLVPEMLERGRGHIVFIASAVGKVGPGYTEPYAATKAGLIALSRSLRAEYAKAPLGFSVVCPGFISGDGMWQRYKEQGLRSNVILGETSVERVAAKVMRAIKRDVPEVVETGAPVKLVLALQELAPRTMERVLQRLGPTKLIRKAAGVRGRLEPSH
jgi:short-subunit dehydrogenase